MTLYGYTMNFHIVTRQIGLVKTIAEKGYGHTVSVGLETTTYLSETVNAIIGCLGCDTRVLTNMKLFLIYKATCGNGEYITHLETCPFVVVEFHCSSPFSKR